MGLVAAAAPLSRQFQGELLSGGWLEDPVGFLSPLHPIGLMYNLMCTRILSFLLYRLLSLSLNSISWPFRHPHRLDTCPLNSAVGQCLSHIVNHLEYLPHLPALYVVVLRGSTASLVFGTKPLAAV